jgi:hypothetical protein
MFMVFWGSSCRETAKNGKDGDMVPSFAPAAETALMGCWKQFVWQPHLSLVTPVLLHPKNPLGARRSYDTAAISAKAKDFAIFARPAAQQLLRQTQATCRACDSAPLVLLLPGRPRCVLAFYY